MLTLTDVMVGEVGIGASFTLLTFAGGFPAQADLIGLYTLLGLNLKGLPGYAGAQ